MLGLSREIILVCNDWGLHAVNVLNGSLTNSDVTRGRGISWRLMAIQILKCSQITVLALLYIPYDLTKIGERGHKEKKLWVVYSYRWESSQHWAATGIFLKSVIYITCEISYIFSGKFLQRAQNVENGESEMPENVATLAHHANQNVLS